MLGVIAIIESIMRTKVATFKKNHLLISVKVA
jgi:hypothetical protein